MARSRSPLWLVSDKVRAAVGPGLSEFLRQMDPQAAITCQVCGRVKPAGVVSPMRVVIAALDAEMPVLGVAHTSCWKRSGDVVPQMASRVSDPDGSVDAQAVFAERPGAAPAAVLIVEPAAVAVGLAPGRSSDGWVRLCLGFGFEPATVDIMDLEPGRAPRWLIDTQHGSIFWGHPDLPGPAYEQPINASHTAWLALARRQGCALVVTGTHIGLGEGLPSMDRLDWARRNGSLVAGVVEVR